MPDGPATFLLVEGGNWEYVAPFPVFRPKDAIESSLPLLGVHPSKGQTAFHTQYYWL